MEYQGSELESALVNARTLLQEEMGSECASAEVLSAMGHVDGALRDLRLRDERLESEGERARLDAEASAQRDEDLAAEAAALSAEA